MYLGVGGAGKVYEQRATGLNSRSSLPLEGLEGEAGDSERAAPNWTGRTAVKLHKSSISKPIPHPLAPRLLDGSYAASDTSYTVYTDRDSSFA